MLYVHMVYMHDFPYKYIRVCMYVSTHIPQALIQHILFNIFIHLIAYFCEQRSTAYKLTQFQLFIMSDK